MLDLQLRYDSLLKQWEEDQGKIEELEGRVEQVATLEAALKNFEADLAAQQDQLAGHDRTIMVKDERIAHLEAQYQKERQRNLNAADAAADATVAAATSYDNEAPPSLSGLGDSLADELSNDYDEFDDMEFYTNELSEISTLVDFMPVEPPLQRLSIGVNENVSVSPIDVAPQRLTIDVNEVGSVMPVERANNVTSASVQTDLQDLATEIVHAASIETAPVTPVVVAATTTSTQTEAPQLTSGVVPTASIAVAPAVPAFNTSLASITTTYDEAPIEALPPKIASRSIAPITVTHEDTPVDVRSTKPATTTIGVQTIENPAAAVQTRIVEVAKSNKMSFLQALLPIVALFLACLSLWQYMRLQAWEIANDYGGAYGNGRRLLGIPLAMDVGGTWWTERIATIASRAITSYEKWAGIEYVPLY
jgi:hypothetical protein